MAGIWFWFGRDARGREVIVPHSEAPKGLKPYEAGTLLADNADYGSFLALILDLAKRGFLLFERKTGSETFVYILERTQKTEGLDAVERAVLKRLFRYPTLPDAQEGVPERTSNTEAIILLFAKRNEQVKLAFQRFVKEMDRSLIARGWHRWPMQKTRLWGAALVTLWFVILTIIFNPASGSWQMLLLAFFFFLFFACVWFLPQLTKEGALMQEAAAGFARYIEVAEKDRLAFHEHPKTAEGACGDLLPYAVAFGIHTEWTKLFFAAYGTV